MIFPGYRTIGPVSGLPLNWRDEVSGVLPNAVNRYLNHRIDGTSIDEIDMEHYINAPCWNDTEEGDLAELRRDVKTLRTPDEMGAWIGRCLDIGIDPL